MFWRSELSDAADVGAIEQDVAGADVVEARDQRAERRLADARGADQGDILAGLYLERDVPQHVGVIVAVAEADVAECYVPRTCFRSPQRRVVDVWLDLEHLHEPVEAGDAFLIEPARS